MQHGRQSGVVVKSNIGFLGHTCEEAPPIDPVGRSLICGGTKGIGQAPGGSGDPAQFQRRHNTSTRRRGVK
jgi:hypothetical protein